MVAILPFRPEPQRGETSDQIPLDHNFMRCFAAQKF